MSALRCPLIPPPGFRYSGATSATASHHLSYRIPHCPSFRISHHLSFPILHCPSFRIYFGIYMPNSPPPVCHSEFISESSTRIPRHLSFRILHCPSFRIYFGIFIPQEFGKHRMDFFNCGIISKTLENQEKIMVKVYCYDRCSTCKKALAWLDEKNIPYEKIDIKSQHPDQETLRQLHKKSGLPLKRFFNTSGMIYREMELSKKLPEMSQDQQFQLLASDGMIVKRPILITDTAVCTGFKEDQWLEALK